MKELLVIGSAVADVIITLPHLPSRSEDVHVKTQQMRLGGCAYNTFDIVRHFHVPAVPFFPVGKGAYGDFVRKALLERGIVSAAPEPDEENGCCYCFVEDDGERTFLSYHGAEYRIRQEWLEALDASKIGSVYICGLEIEEPTGEGIVAWLEKHPMIRVFFAPGPRLLKIRPDLMKRLFALHPVLHLNLDEACRFTGTDSLENAAEALHVLTNNSVLITLGAQGCYVLEAADPVNGSADVMKYTVQGVRTKQVDTIGAGDSHIGAVMSMLMRGYSLRTAVEMANRISAKVVGVHGALLSEEEFAQTVKLPVS